MPSNILLINIDSKIPNLPLKKVEIFHRNRGDQIQWDLPLATLWADKIYVSCVFTWNRDQCAFWADIDKAVIGGSGWDLSVRLPDEIETIKPHINLGFTTRGCIRKCGFCIVPEKEGKIRVVGDLMDLWDGEAEDVTVLDNNILALPDHFMMICYQAQKYGIRLDFNQGLDHRLLTDPIVALMQTTRHKGEYRFAFDHPDSIDSVKKAIRLLRRYGINRAFWYVLVAYDTTLDEDLFRLNYLRSVGQTVFVQRYNKDKATLRLAQWANQHHIFKAMTYSEFLVLKDGGK